MLDKDNGITLTDSGEFNAMLWAARADGNDQLADQLLAIGVWVNTAEGVMTRRAELDPEQSEEIRRLIGSAAAGLLDIHPAYQQTAEEMQSDSDQSLLNI